MEFVVRLDSPFDLGYTLESGQVFRWEHRGEWWYAVLDGGVLKVKRDGETLGCVSSSRKLDGRFVANYFRLEEDPRPILTSIMGDGAMSRAIQEFYGMRIIRQDPWECLASFVLATNSNIPRIKKMVSSLCTAFGERLAFESDVYSAFPTAEVLAGANLASLRSCGLGYRAPFLKTVARAVDSGGLNLGELALRDYAEAKQLLLSRLPRQKLLMGVGPKVADCVLLFSCHHDEAFPIDVWVARALLRFYPELFPPTLREKLRAVSKKKSLTSREYELVSAAAIGRFGRYAGYAQQYLFMLARSESPE